MNNDSTRRRRVQKTLGLHYSRFYLIARCIDSLFRRKILENRSSAAPVEKVGLMHSRIVPTSGLCRVGAIFHGLRSRRGAAIRHNTRGPVKGRATFQTESN